MDSITQTLMMWRNEGVIIAMILGGVILFHYALKLWSAPADIALGVILGVSMAVAGGGLYFMHFFGIAYGSRAFWFTALYMWCVLGMLFFAARNTHRIKLFLGLISQAGILYALFVLL